MTHSPGSKAQKISGAHDPIASGPIRVSRRAGNAGEQQDPHDLPGRVGREQESDCERTAAERRGVRGGQSFDVM